MKDGVSEGTLSKRPLRSSIKDESYLLLNVVQGVRGVDGKADQDDV